MQFDNHRRRLLKQSLALTVTALAGCRDGTYISVPVGDESTTPSTSTPSTPPAPPPPTTASTAGIWAPNVPTFIVGSASSFNLAATLPKGVALGGTFGVDPGGIPLPPGMSLQPNGTLSVGSATVGTVTGVLFTYNL
jgi:hypothetical protein